MRRLKIFCGIILAICFLFANIISVFAQTNSNNKFGIHIASATTEEAKEAAKLINSGGGDWGYVTVVIQLDDRRFDKWQNFFNELRKLHLIPIVRIATQNTNGYWEKPYEKEEEAWANFLDELIWPTKTKHIVIYNEPNHASEWGNSVDPVGYAQVLNSTIDALKAKSSDFFILNAGFDASAPQKPPAYFDEAEFLLEMNEAVPQIFNKLDGWTSHSYPAPNFTGSPLESGRGTIKTYEWELGLIKSLGVSKDLPVFITETGWKHSEGIEKDSTFLKSETVADHYKFAFENVWNDPKIITITPFILNYQDNLFDHFSFKKVDGTQSPSNVLGISTDVYYPQFQTIQDLPKLVGNPIRENKAKIERIQMDQTLTVGQKSKIKLTFKNTGQKSWNDDNQVKLIIVQAGLPNIQEINLTENLEVNPNEEYLFEFEIAPQKTEEKLNLILFANDRSFDSKPEEITLFSQESLIQEQITRENNLIAKIIKKFMEIFT